jgi:glycerol-3-phosphate dehydrogenase (NAD(P)+)
MPKSMATITVLGAGMMGSALCVPLVDRGHEVRLVGTLLDGEIVESLKNSGIHPKLKLELPRSIRPFADAELEAALPGSDVLILGVSSAGVRWAGARLTGLALPPLPIAMITKGLEWDGEKLRVLPDVLHELLPEPVRARVQPVGVAGPCIAGELARRVQTCVVFTGRDAAAIERFAELARGPYYHVQRSADVVGVEVCAALKNAYAMGIAFAVGLHERAGGQPGSVAMHNYESAVFAQSVLEMQKIVAIAGGDPATAAGLAGVGDLDVTCNGGRTGRFGRLLGLGLGLPEAIAGMEGATLECLEILEVLRAALPALEARGELQPRELPLLRQLMAVALDGEPIAMPFGEFVGARP